MKATFPTTPPASPLRTDSEAAPAAAPKVALNASEHALLTRSGHAAQTARRERNPATRLPRLDTTALPDAGRATPRSAASSASGPSVFSAAASVGTPMTPMSPPTPGLSRASTGRSSTHPAVDARSDELVAQIHALHGPQTGEHVRKRFDQLAGLATDPTRHALALGIRELHGYVESELGASRSGLKTFQTKGSLWRAQLGGLFGKSLTRPQDNASGAAIAQRRTDFLQTFDHNADQLMQRFSGGPA